MTKLSPFTGDVHIHTCMNPACRRSWHTYTYSELGRVWWRYCAGCARDRWMQEQHTGDPAPALRYSNGGMDG